MRSSWMALSLVSFLAASPVLAQDDPVMLVQASDSGDDAARAVARARAATRLVRATLDELGVSHPALEDVARRRAAIQGVYRLLQQERFGPQGRMFRYTARVDRAAARVRIREALGAGPAFAGMRLAVEPAAQAALPGSVVGTVTRELARKLGIASPGAGEEELRITISGSVEYVPFPAGTPQAAVFSGYLRCVDVAARVRTGAEGAEELTVALRHDARDVVREPEEARPDNVHQPRLARRDDPDAARERYGAEVGRLLAAAVSQRLHGAWFHIPLDRSAAPRPQGPECPGCAFAAPAAEDACPACDAPLPPR